MDYESAFFADLVAAYTLEKSEDIFDDSIFFKIYRDDGIDIKNKILSIDEICDWLKLFQNRVNQLTGSEYLQFTCDVWMSDTPPDLKPKNKKVKINRKSAFPYLDMELNWINDELKFKVHHKKVNYSNISTKDLRTPMHAFSKQYHQES